MKSVLEALGLHSGATEAEALGAIAALRLAASRGPTPPAPLPKPVVRNPAAIAACLAEIRQAYLEASWRNRGRALFFRMSPREADALAGVTEAETNRMTAEFVERRGAAALSRVTWLDGVDGRRGPVPIATWKSDRLQVVSTAELTEAERTKIQNTPAFI